MIKMCANTLQILANADDTLNISRNYQGLMEAFSKLKSAESVMGQCCHLYGFRIVRPGEPQK